MAQELDITGQKFGKLTAIKSVGNQKWLFKCDCGSQKVINTRNVTSGHTKSCGCLQIERSVKYHSGQRFGSVVLVRPDGKGYWILHCDCGKEFKALPYPYKIGKNRTCGCSLYDGSRQTTHDQSRTNIYRIWQGIKRRCYNPKYSGFENYGGRGIKMCDRWLHSFENFLADMGERPSKEYSIDRIDVNGDYCPENCRWATWKQQMNNTTKTIHLSHNGVTHSITEWSEIYGIPLRTAHNRYSSGYSFEKIFGKGHAARTLTDDEVRDVRKYNLTAIQFFERFGKKVSDDTLRLIKKHKTYKDVV